MEPSKAYKEQLYHLYNTLIKSTINHKKKRYILNSIFVYEKWSWRVTGITYNALRLVHKNDFYPKPKGLVRGHKNDRATTYDRMLQKRMELNDWWHLFCVNDETDIMTKAENDTGKLSKVIKIDWKLGYFQNAGLVGFKYRKKKEGQFLIEKYNEITLSDKI